MPRGHDTVVGDSGGGDQVVVYVVGENMEQCIREEIAGSGYADKVIREAIELLLKSR